MALSLNDIKKKRAPLPPKSGATKRAVMPWQDRGATVGDSNDVEQNLIHSAEAASEPGAKGHAEAASEPGAKGHAEAASEPGAKGHANINPKRLISKNYARDLSRSVKYNLAAQSWLKILSEICKLCIENESLKTEKTSYDYLSKHTEINAESVRRIIRTLEAEGILIFSKEYFQTGSKGRLFEVSEQAMLCMLTHDISLRKWIARQGIPVSDIKKFYDFM